MARNRAKYLHALFQATMLGTVYTDTGMYAECVYMVPVHVYYWLKNISSLFIPPPFPPHILLP
jgi:hypothetical protein